MKGKRGKPWLPILVILGVIAGFYASHPFVPASTPKATPASVGSPAKDTPEQENHPELPNARALSPRETEKAASSRPRLETFLSQTIARLNKAFSSWPTPTPAQLQVTLFVLLALALLWSIGRRALYQRRIRAEIDQGYQTLNRLAQQAESADLAVVEQALARLTEVHEQLAKPVSAPLSHLSAFYFLRAHADYTLHRVKDRCARLREASTEAQKEKASALALMQAMDEKLAKLAKQLSSAAWPAHLHPLSWMEVAMAEATAAEERPVEWADNAAVLAEPVSDGAPESAEVAAPSQPADLPAEESHAATPETHAGQEAVAPDDPRTASLATALDADAAAEISATGVPKKKSGRPSVISRSIRQFLNLSLRQKQTSAEPPPDAQAPSEARPGREASEAPPTAPKTRAFAKLYFWKKGDSGAASAEKPAPSQPLPDSPGPDPLPQTDEAAGAAAAGNRQSSAQTLVRKHMVAAMALSAVPVPILDVAALTGIQLNLLSNLSALHGVAFNRESGKSVLVALLGGSLPTTALMWLSSLSKAVPGIGTLTGGVSLSATAGAVTYAIGQVFIRHFEAGNALQDFDAKQQRSHFQNALKEGLAMAASEHAK